MSPPGSPPHPKSAALGKVALGLSGMGFPLTQLVIRRFGRRGARVVEGVCVGLLIRDAALVAAGAPRRLRRGAAILLWLELAAAAVAAGSGLRLAFDEASAAQAAEPLAEPREAVRRAAVGLLFGLHTVRFRIYLQPDKGRKRPAPEERSAQL